MALGTRRLTTGQPRKLAPVRRALGGNGMGSAQLQPRPPAAPNGIPTPGVGLAPGPRPVPPVPVPPVMPPAPRPVPPQGGAPGVYQYDIGGSPNFNGNMDMNAINAMLARTNSQFNQLPLAPGTALAQAGLLSGLQARLAAAQQGYADTAAQGNLAFGRLGTDQLVANEQLGGNMADRGILSPGSGVAQQGYQMQAADFNRQRQDLAQSVQQALGGYLQQTQGAYGDYAQGLGQLALEQAQKIAADRAYGTGAR